MENFSEMVQWKKCIKENKRPKSIKNYVFKTVKKLDYSKSIRMKKKLTGNLLSFFLPRKSKCAKLYLKKIQQFHIKHI